MGTFFKQVVSKAGSDGTASAKYVAVRHHSLLLNICEGLGGFFMEVADELLQSERRTAVTRSRETTTRGVVKISFRAPRRNKGARASHTTSRGGRLRAMPF